MESELTDVFGCMNRGWRRIYIGISC